MVEIDYAPHGVCSRNIHVALSDDGGTIEDVRFTGGCSGNLQAISKLVRNEPTERIIEILEGNTCGPRSTSCADQLTKALRAAEERAAGATKTAGAAEAAPQAQA